MAMSLFVSFKEYLDKKESQRHNEIKAKIKAFQEIRSMHSVMKHSDKEIIKIDKKLQKLTKQLNKSHRIYCL